ncbi:MAG TPA: nucleotidyl transferase AbiEii/AbiGii toxin family protein [Candidatus Brocadiia bacterium]|nr:nucleotidyl transferase AbiEii/AbiGii toxin family protein [Candidatus Brocadiales bacterium]
MIKFQELFSALNKSKVRYLVAGGIAVNLYGIERATADIDLVVDPEENNLERFINAIKELGLKPKVPVRLEDFIKKEKRERWVIEKGMRVFSIFDPKNPYLLLDVFVEEPFNFKKVFEARNEMKAGKTIIPVVPLKDLIEMKEKTGRPQDIADAFYLKKIKEEWKDEG